MKRFIIIAFLAAFSCSVVLADQQDDYGLVSCIIENGDTIPFVQLRPFYCFPPMKFKNQKQEKFYWRTVRDVKKTLPYAKIIGQEYARIEKELVK